MPIGGLQDNIHAWTYISYLQPDHCSVTITHHQQVLATCLSSVASASWQHPAMASTSLSTSGALKNERAGSPSLADNKDKKKVKKARISGGSGKFGCASAATMCR